MGCMSKRSQGSPLGMLFRKAAPVSRGPVKVVREDDIDARAASEDDEGLSDDAVSALDGGLLPSLVGYQLKRAHDKVYRSFSDHLATLGLTPGQFGVLMLIAANPGSTQTDLARGVGSNRSFMVRMIDRLEALGLIERGAVPLDRRSYAISVTPDGTEMVARLTEDVVEHEYATLSRLTRQETEKLLALLVRLNG